MMRRQKQLRLEQLDERPSILDLRGGDGVDLIGNDGDIDRAELLGKRLDAGVIEPALPISTTLKLDRNVMP